MIPIPIIRKCCAIANGDLRQLLRQLKSTHKLGEIDKQYNVFDSTKYLLHGSLSTEQWLETSEYNTLECLMHTNYLQFKPLDGLKMAALFSDLDIFHNSKQIDYAGFLLGQTFVNTHDTSKKVFLEFKSYPVKKNTHCRVEASDDVIERLRVA